MFIPKKNLTKLVGEYRDRIERLERRVIAKEISDYVSVPIPQMSDSFEYTKSIANIVDNSLTLFYLTQLRRSIVDEFQHAGKDNSEFYRGQLAAIGKIFDDATKARQKVATGAV
jgi:hypothetical protein